jgi:predicted N-acyltransferase
MNNSFPALYAGRRPPLVLRDDVPLESIPAGRWNAIALGQPLLAHAFLSALHETGCASPATGWVPRYISAWGGDELVGAIPLYAKAHSYGEYVFDWAWADAYRRYGRRYYPKLVAAIPFTPTSGPRLLAIDDTVQAALLAHARGMLHGGAYSSLHVLFPTAQEATRCAGAGMLMRHGVQFHWDNPGYLDFADFLAAFNHGKRKKVKQERRKLAEAGVRFTRKIGADITHADWAFFYGCYERTYHAHGSTPYLSLEFFERIGETLPENILLVIGARAGRRVCAALDIFDAGTLWGRYWGATEFVRAMHFEACYYQAIEFCIERRIRRFEGGAQGAHKLARGLMPVTTHSAHAIADPAFIDAIAHFCERERVDVAHTVDELETASPFRDAVSAESGQ